MISYAEALKRPAPTNPDKLKEFNTLQTNELFRKIKGYDGRPMSVVRQFSCRYCYKMWWTRVRTFKQVSKCKMCMIKYDPIPVDLEFGSGFFECKNQECLNKFIGKIQMGLSSLCYKCKQTCYPSFIINRQNDPRLGLVRMTNRHSCSSCNGKGSCRLYNTIMAFSEIHISTDSTLASLNIQNDLNERFIDDFDEIDLPGIRESTDEDCSF